jgi:NADH:ubiquinone oxidoreductase subunit H
VKIAGVFSVVMAMVAYAVLAERRIAAFIQDRIGPNRVGPLGGGGGGSLAADGRWSEVFSQGGFYAGARP